MTSENTRNDLAAQQHLDRAADALKTSGDQLSPSEFIQASAAIGFGYSQLAHLDDQRANRVDDLDRIGVWRTEDLERIGAADQRNVEAEAVATEAHRAVAEVARRQLELLDPNDKLIAALRRGQQPGPSCEFVFRGQRCVFGLDHPHGWHHLQDGREVDDAGELLGQAADRG